MMTPPDRPPCSEAWSHLTWRMARARDSMSSDQAAQATAIVEDTEEDRQTIQLMPRALELTHWLHAHQEIPTALVTRNTKRSAQVLHDKLLAHTANLTLLFLETMTTIHPNRIQRA